jgi:hypothetical protein
MSARPCHSSRAHTVMTGVLLLLSGVALLAALRGWWEIERYAAFWPLVFLFPAVNRLMAPPEERSLAAGLAWMGVAALLISLNLGYVHLRLRDLLPLLLVGLGVRLLYRSRTHVGGTR